MCKTLRLITWRWTRQCLVGLVQWAIWTQVAILFFEDIIYVQKRAQTHINQIRDIYTPGNAHKADSLKLPTGFDKWQGWTKTIKHMQVLLFFGQGVKNAMQINQTLQQASVTLDLSDISRLLWFLVHFNNRLCLGQSLNLFTEYSW